MIDTSLYIIVSNYSAVVGNYTVNSLTARNMNNFKFTRLRVVKVGRDRSVGIAIRYGMDGLEIEYQWGEIFCTGPDRCWRPPIFLYNSTDRGMALTINPHLAPRLKKQ